MKYYDGIFKSFFKLINRFRNFIYLDCNKGVNLENLTKLKILILENIHQLKNMMVFPKSILKKS